MLAEIDLLPTRRTWSCLADQIGVDIFIAIRCSLLFMLPLI